MPIIMLWIVEFIAKSSKSFSMCSPSEGAAMLIVMHHGSFPFFSYGNYHVVMEFEQQMPLNCDQIFMVKFKTYVAECVAFYRHGCRKIHEVTATCSRQLNFDVPNRNKSWSSSL